MSYRGLKRIKFVWRGEWSDPILNYKGQNICYWDVESLLWEDYGYSEDHRTEDGFDRWINKNKSYCYAEIDALLN